MVVRTCCDAVQINRCEVVNERLETNTSTHALFRRVEHLNEKSHIFCSVRNSRTETKSHIKTLHVKMKLLDEIRTSF